MTDNSALLGAFKTQEDRLMPKATKKPVTIDFVEWTGKNHRDMFNFLGGAESEPLAPSGDNFYISHEKVVGGLMIKTKEGEHKANIGDLIIKGVAGEFYPCKPDIFKATYDVVAT